MKPAADFARNGFRVSEDQVFFMDRAAKAGSDEDFLSKDPAWSQDFAPDGRRVGLGDIMKRKRLARTLDTIAAEGVDAFYTGDIANFTIQALQANRGIMTLQDLNTYTAITRNPSQISYRDFNITSTRAPASGGIALSVLKTIEGYGPLFQPGNESLSYHRLDEAMRFGYASVSLSSTCCRHWRHWIAS